EAEVARIQVLLDGLFLLEDTPSGGALGKATREWIGEWLRLDPSDHFGRHALQHLVAIQLAPREAIAYDRSNPRPRWRLIDDYLGERFSLDAGERARVSRLVARVLDRAGAERGLGLLAREQANECAICRLPFTVEPLSVSTRDPYKPTWLAPA